MKITTFVCPSLLLKFAIFLVLCPDRSLGIMGCPSLTFSSMQLVSELIVGVSERAFCEGF